MKFLSFANIAILSLLITVNPFSLISKVEAQDLNTDELKSTNLGCTNSLKTVLGQRSPDYCTSSEANSGILFDKFEVTRNSDRSINLNLRVFNRGSADGLIEVYDSSQRLQDIKIIDGNRPPTGFLQSGAELFKVPASLFSRYPLGDSRKNLQEQNISIKIPAGGSIKVSKSSSYALRYNTIMLAIEVAQLAKGDSEYTKSNSRKEVIVGFIKDAIFSRDSKAAINIFKSEPTTNALFSLDFIDKEKLAIFLQQILKYSVTIENDPSKNPFVGAIFDVGTDLGNIGIEKAIDYFGLGLGNLVRAIRIGGSGVNTYARAVDLFNATASGQKSTVILRDAKSFNSGLTSQSSSKHPAEVVAADFYNWYINNQYSHRDLLYQKRNSFTSNLYRYLDRAIRISNLPVQRRSVTLNYDLFSFAQVSSYSFKVDSLNVRNDVAEVYLTLRTNLRPPGIPNPLKIVLARNGDSWQIVNIFYLKYPDKNYNLLSELVKFNSIPEFRDIP